MRTSYFSNIKNVTKPISIAAGAPRWYVGAQYMRLAPKYDTLKDYKSGKIDKDQYTKEYHEKVLNLLDADVIYAYLTSIYNEEVTLLCWEKPGQFCHRNLVAKWFKDQLDIDITELGQDEVV